jgi:predicted dehydrogenase
MPGITRRSFSSGLLTAGAITAFHPSTLNAFVAGEKIRAAVIGCRIRGTQLAKRVLDNDRLELVALCDCDAAVLDDAKKSITAKASLPAGLRTTGDFRKIIDDKTIDAVFIATPDHWHAIMAILAIQSGKHVYLEKPASYNIDEGKAMVAAHVKHPELTFVVGTQQRSAPHFADAREFVRSGELGRIGFVRAWVNYDQGKIPNVPDSDPPSTFDYGLWLGPAPHRPYNEACVHYNWHFMHHTGTGYAGNWGAHWLDIARWYLDVDLPNACSAHGVKVYDDAQEWPDTHTAIFEYPDLTLLWEQRNWTEHKIQNRQSGIEFHGEQGAVLLDRGGWTFYPKAGGRKSQSHRASGPDMTIPHIANFADCIAGAASPAAPIEEGHRTAVLCHLANIAARVHRRIEFDPQTQTIPHDKEAASYTSRTYRDPWKLPTV